MILEVGWDGLWTHDFFWALTISWSRLLARTTLHDFGGVLGRPLDTRFLVGSHNFVVTALGSCVKWPSVSCDATSHLWRLQASMGCFWSHICSAVPWAISSSTRSTRWAHFTCVAGVVAYKLPTEMSVRDATLLSECHPYGHFHAH